MKTIGVIFGGKSLEHDISILTGLQVISNLKVSYSVVPIYIAKDGKWWTGEKLKKLESYLSFNKQKLNSCYLIPNSKNLFIKTKLRTKEKQIDALMIALHGQNGEDGAIHGLLKLSGIPFSSSDVLGSALTMDKVVLKMILKGNGLNTPNFFSFSKTSWEKDKESVLDEIEKSFDFNVVIKPARAGSSIGVTRCKTREEVKEAIEVAICFDTKIIVEEAISNFREINVAVLGNGEKTKISCFEEVKHEREILDFDEKYLNAKDVTRIVDVKLEKNITEKIKEIAQKSFELCECFGVVRMDFFVKDDEVLLNEINSIPGSLANYLWKDLSFERLCDALISFAEKRQKEEEKLVLNYDTNVLKDFCGQGKMKK